MWQTKLWEYSMLTQDLSQDVCCIYKKTYWLDWWQSRRHLYFLSFPPAVHVEQTPCTSPAKVSAFRQKASQEIPLIRSRLSSRLTPFDLAFIWFPDFLPLDEAIRSSTKTTLEWNGRNGTTGVWNRPAGGLLQTVACILYSVIELLKWAFWGDVGTKIAEAVWKNIMFFKKKEATLSMTWLLP